MVNNLVYIDSIFQHKKKYFYNFNLFMLITDSFNTQVYKSLLLHMTVKQFVFRKINNQNYQTLTFYFDIFAG